MPLLKFRTSNHKLPIEVGRWNNIDIPDRKCTICNLGDLGDEYHYIFNCTFFTDERRTYINKRWYVRPNILKFQNLMQTNKKSAQMKPEYFS